MTILIIKTIFLCAIAYLIGAIPTGVIISKKVFGFDIRTKGSGNMGSTNVMRVLGTKWGVVVQILDILKGVFPVLMLANVIGRNWDMFGEGSFLSLHILEIMVGLSAIVGHIFTCFAQFKGGKGINTALGMLLAIIPLETLSALVFFIIVVGISGYVSLASMIAISILPICFLIRHNCIDAIDGYLTLMYFILSIVVLVFIVHRSNIVRLIRKTENKIEKWQFLCKNNKKEKQ
ncbi:MAG: glycerol-3-phosphate 1-O-acyltransferase PlsY [Bacteroidetes bacterium]|nr:glycerol-3-phosphate 1-O-acyltransferase PlsY [Bacteroidota bacterium]